MSPDLRYPVGRFRPPDRRDAAERAVWIEEVAALPGQLRAAVAGLDEERLRTPYRPGGWTVRQVVHHLPDSHLNSYCRFKLALTQESPTICPYDEAAWAGLPDTERSPIELSLVLLEALHARWSVLLRAMSEDDFERGYVHPEHRARISLDVALAMYAWHGRHHVAHITGLRERMGWR